MYSARDQGYVWCMLHRSFYIPIIVTFLIAVPAGGEKRKDKKTKTKKRERK